MTTEQTQTLTPIITSDGKYTLSFTQQEFEEITYALEVLRKKREASRVCQRKKYEKEAALRNAGEKRHYRKALNLVINNPQQ